MSKVILEKWPWYNSLWPNFPGIPRNHLHLIFVSTVMHYVLRPLRDVCNPIIGLGIRIGLIGVRWQQTVLDGRVN